MFGRAKIYNQDFKYQNLSFWSLYSTASIEYWFLVLVPLQHFTLTFKLSNILATDLCSPVI